MYPNQTVLNDGLRFKATPFVSCLFLFFWQTFPWFWLQRITGRVLLFYVSMKTRLKDLVFRSCGAVSTAS